MPYCQQCELVHGEEQRFCQRCGQLLKRGPLSGRACSRCGVLTYPGQKFCTDCGLPLRTTSLGREESPQQGRTSVFYPRTSPRSADSRAKRGKRHPGLAISLVVIVLIALGGLYGWRQLVKGPSTPSVVVAPQQDMRRDVERLAEKIRAAHLSKDINKWLNCYSPDYPDLGRLENQILELWKNYDIKEVSYRISDVERLGDRQVSALLVWHIQVYDHRTYDYMLLRPAYKVTLEKDGDNWKIRASREEDVS
jgi:RNA polymerase subunit RPABC4/transcription elongation factor Spt4